MSARNRWVGIIVALLAINVLATVVLAVKAGVPKTVPGYHELAPPSKAPK
jgi:ABC-type multidrug transport system permease subunit